jgi:hypothetical protein
MCRIALISWPTTDKTPSNCYINLGEMYDKVMKTDSILLSQFNRELRFLYPFRYVVSKNACYNMEDFNVFKDKYRLTIGIRLFGKIPEKDTITFRTPVLYDVTCMVPLILPHLITPVPVYIPDKKVCIVLPHLNPLIRGCILDEVVRNRPETIVLVGQSRGKNKDSTATLMTRYLRRLGVPMKCIIKSPIDKKPECILDALALLEMMDVPDNYSVVVACSTEDITLMQKSIRFWRKKGLITKRISYYCPYC